MKTEWSQGDRRWLATLGLSPEASGLVCRGSEEERRRCIEIVVDTTREGYEVGWHADNIAQVIVERIAEGRK